jgi:hypothetical protein
VECSFQILQADADPNPGRECNQMRILRHKISTRTRTLAYLHTRHFHFAIA